MSITKFQFYSYKCFSPAETQLLVMWIELSNKKKKKKSPDIHCGLFAFSK